MIDRIMRCQYKRMNQGVWDTVSEEAKAFVASLLQIDPALRPTAKQALESPWIQKSYPTDAVVQTANKYVPVQPLTVLLAKDSITSRGIDLLDNEFKKYDEGRNWEHLNNKPAQGPWLPLGYGQRLRYQTHYPTW